MTSILDVLPAAYKEKDNFEDKDKNDYLTIIWDSLIVQSLTWSGCSLPNIFNDCNDFENINNIFKANCLKMYSKNRKEITSILQKKIDLIGISFSEKAIYNKIFSYLSLNDILVLYTSPDDILILRYYIQSMRLSNGINQIDSSMRTRILKTNANNLGKVNNSRANEESSTTQNNNINSHLKKVRNGGYVVPPKVTNRPTNC